MIVLGLTGSMAMGKSTALKMLAAMEGVAVHDSDLAVKNLYENAEIIDLIKTTFPSAWIKKTNTIDKKKLREELGSDHEKWDALEKIIHPYVRASQDKFLREQRALGTKIAVLDIPLLFETGAQTRVDYTICMTAPDFIQQQRIDERIRQGFLTPEDAAFRLSRQLPDSEKRKRADFIIQTGAGLDFTRRALDDMIRKIKERHLGNGHSHIPPHLS